MGVDLFVKRIKQAGASALIVPNLPVEESDALLTACRKHNIHLVFLVTPTTTEERLKKIIDVSSGFIYVVNVAGVTGAREEVQDSTLKLIQRIRKHTDLPLLAGFGISKPEHAKAVISAGADGAIVGSAIAKIYEKKFELESVASFVREMKTACSLRERRSASHAASDQREERSTILLRNLPEGHGLLRRRYKYAGGDNCK